MSFLNFLLTCSWILIFEWILSFIFPSSYVKSCVLFVFGEEMRLLFYAFGMLVSRVLRFLLILLVCLLVFHLTLSLSSPSLSLRGSQDSEMKVFLSLYFCNDTQLSRSFPVLGLYNFSF